MNIDSAVAILAGLQIVIGVILFYRENNFKKQLAEIQKTINIVENKTKKFQEKQLDEILNLYSELVSLEDYLISLVFDSHPVVSVNSYLPLPNLDIFSISTLYPDEQRLLKLLNFDLKFYKFLYLKRKYELFHNHLANLNLAFIKKNLFLPKELRKAYVNGLVFYASKLLQIREKLDHSINQYEDEPKVDEFFDCLLEIRKEMETQAHTKDVFNGLNKILETIFDPEKLLNN